MARSLTSSGWRCRVIWIGRLPWPAVGNLRFAGHVQRTVLIKRPQFMDDDSPAALLSTAKRVAGPDPAADARPHSQNALGAGPAGR